MRCLASPCCWTRWFSPRSGVEECLLRPVRVGDPQIFPPATAYHDLPRPARRRELPADAVQASDTSAL